MPHFSSLPDGGLSDGELVLICCIAKYIKGRILESKESEGGWDKLLAELDDLIELADSGFTISLINKLYRSSSY